MKKTLCNHSSSMQLGLLGFQSLSVEIVSIGPSGITSDRFAIEVREHDLRWRFPIQWQIEELDTVRRVVRQFDWSLSFEDGTPIASKAIYEAFERLLGGGDTFAQHSVEGV